MFQCCFNPTLVRLRPNHKISVLQRAMKFQSHAGSIEAGGDLGDAVRYGLEFQSHAGSIEAVLIPLHHLLERGFNPTLVRLRPQNIRTDALHRYLFQSHAGSIEAVLVAPPPRSQRQFQSHAGSIEARSRPDVSQGST